MMYPTWVILPRWLIPASWMTWLRTGYKGENGAARKAAPFFYLQKQSKII